MKTLATLHAEQKMDFDEQFKSSYAYPFVFDETCNEDVKNFITAVTLSQIDLMIEIVKSKKKKISEKLTCDGDIEDYGYNTALSDLSTLLSAQRELINLDIV